MTIAEKDKCVRCNMRMKEMSLAMSTRNFFPIADRWKSFCRDAVGAGIFQQCIVAHRLDRREVAMGDPFRRG